MRRFVLLVGLMILTSACTEKPSAAINKPSAAKNHPNQTPLESWSSPVGSAAQSYLNLYRDGQFELTLVGDTVYDVKREDGTDPNTNITRGTWQRTASGITLNDESGGQLRKLYKECYEHTIHLSEKPGKDPFEEQSLRFGPLSDSTAIACENKG